MKRIFLIIVGALMVVIVGYSIFTWMRAKSEVQQYCSQLSEGTSVDAAKKGDGGDVDEFDHFRHGGRGVVD